MRVRIRMHGFHTQWLAAAAGALWLGLSGTPGIAQDRSAAAGSPAMMPMHASPPAPVIQAQAQSPAPARAAPRMSAMDHAMPNASFTLVTGIADGKMVFIGRGGKIDGKVNPTLEVNENDTVQITLINGEGQRHDIVVPDFR